MTDSRTDQLVERLRAGVRQRRAEQTARRHAGSAARLEELKRHQTLREHSPTSHRKLLGPLLVAAKTLVGRFLLRWYVQPLLEQQSLYNLAASRAILDLAEASEELRREISELRAELDELRSHEAVAHGASVTSDGS